MRKEKEEIIDQSGYAVNADKKISESRINRITLMTQFFSVKSFNPRKSAIQTI